MRDYDVAIIGAGPAGLFAAKELLGSDLKVIIVERGAEPSKRRSISHGVGGAGAFSDGKLNLSPTIGGDPASFKRTEGEIRKYIEEVDHTFTRFGATMDYSGTSEDELDKLRKKASKYGIEFISGRQKHIGTKLIRQVVDKFFKNLKKEGVDFLLETEVLSIKRKGEKFSLVAENDEVEADFVIAVPGRSGAYWLREQAKELGIKTLYGPIDVGLRVEFPAEIYEEIESIMYDAKFRLRTDTYDDLVRTFCTNPRGFVVKEEHKDFVLVNGHAENERKTTNTNFALLSRIELTDPVEDTTEYGRAIAKFATTIGGGRPIIQRLKDLKSGRRSTYERIKRAAIKPTLEDVTPGDISMALPHRVVVDMLEGLERLDHIIEGLYSDHTLIYAPEIKFYDTKYIVDKNMQTSLKHFYVAGDASGHSRGIVYSAVTGMLAAEGIKESAGLSRSRNNLNL